MTPNHRNGFQRRDAATKRAAQYENRTHENRSFRTDTAQQPTCRGQEPPHAGRLPADVPHPPDADAGARDRRGICLLQRRTGARSVARRGAFPAPQRSARPRRDPRPRDLRQLYGSGRSRPLRAGARHLALHPGRNPLGGAAEDPLGRARLGIQRRAHPDLRLVRRPPLNYSLDNIPRTQTIEPVYIETSAFFIFPRELWCSRHRRIGDRPWMAVVDRIEGLDIDYPEDFAMAEIIAASRKLPQ